MFLLPACSIVVKHGASIPSTLLILTALMTLPFISRKEPLFKQEIILLLIFCAFFVWAIISMYISEINSDALRRIGVYSRFFTFVPVYFLIRRVKPNINWLLAGVVAGSLAAGTYAIAQIWFELKNYYPGRASGTHNPIYFGNTALLLGFISLAMINTCKTNFYKAIVLLGFIMGLTACMLSGSRGSWLAIPFLSLLIIMQHWHAFSSKAKFRLIAAFICIPLLLYSIPQTGVTQRIETTDQQLFQYDAGLIHNNSVGLRLEMWRIAFDIFKAKPLMGAGTGSYPSQKKQLIASGTYHQAVISFKDPHNEYLNVMATRGIIGLLILLAILLYPIYLLNRYRNAKSSEIRALAYVGLHLAIGYIFTSLTAASFERVLPITFYVFIMYSTVAMLHIKLAANNAETKQRASSHITR